MCKMIEVAQQHGNVLQARWRLVEQLNAPVALRIIQDQPQDAIVRALVSLPGGGEQTMELHWPLQSGALFDTLNQAAQYLAVAQGDIAIADRPGAVADTPAMRPAARLDGASGLLQEFLQMRSTAGVLQLMLEGRPVLQLEIRTDRCHLLAGEPEAIVQRLRSAADANWAVGAAALPQGGERRTCGEFMWLMAEASAEQGLLPQFEGSLITLRGWPAQAVRGPVSWLRIMKRLRHASCSVDQLIAATQPTMPELAWFLNGCLATDHVRLQPSRVAQVSEARPVQITPVRSRFRDAFSAIRSALGMARPTTRLGAKHE
jgi:hypothetical protein